MNWKRWRIGLAVAAFTGLLTGLIGLAVGVSLKAAGVLLVVSMAKDMLLFLKDHPVDQVADDSAKPATKTIAGSAAVMLLCLGLALGAPGCAHTPTLAPGGAYAPTNSLGGVTIAPDPAFYAVDAAFYVAYSAVDNACVFEQQNRALLWKLSPSIKHALDSIRPQIWQAVIDYSRARQGYLSAPTPAGLTGLQAILAKAQQLATAAAAALPGQSTNAAPVPSGQASTPAAALTAPPTGATFTPLPGLPK